MLSVCKRLLPIILAGVAAGSLAACGGGGGSHNTVLPGAGPGVPVEYTGPLANATFTITIPGPKSSAFARRPAYVSSATKSIKITLNTASALTAAQVTAYNARPWGTINTGTLPNATCPASGADFVCTETIQLPPGTDNLTFNAYDNTNGTGNILSGQIKSFTFVAATNNSFSVILDANASTMAVSATSGFCAGSFTVPNSGSVATVGTTSVTFSVGFTDAAGKTIVSPGLPLLTVNGHTDDNGGLGYTDGTTHLNVKVNQSAQNFTLTQTAGTGSAAVTMSATPPGSDGLSFNKALAFTFSSGPSPPSQFLATGEQIINTSGVVTGGQIDFYTMSLGTSDTFTAYSPASLSNVNSDVDFPNDLLFDGNGDLLIANGGAGNPDFGNFACVPAGSITTGTNNVTVIASNGNTNTFDDPTAMALGADSSVAITNSSFGASTPDVAVFALGAAYAAAPSRYISHATYGSAGTHNIIALPASTFTSGTYLVSITDTTQAGTHVVFHPPSGSDTSLPNSPRLTDPFIGYDPHNNEVVVADNNGSSSAMTSWDATSKSQVTLSYHTFIDDGAGNSQAVPTSIAVSPSGYVAISVIVSVGPEVFLYDNSTIHAPLTDPNPGRSGIVLGPVAFDATTAPFGSTFVYGGLNAVDITESMRWLTGTKLLVCLYSQHSHVQTSANGLYIIDVTQNGQAYSGYDAFGNPYPIGPKISGFQALSNVPLATAYKP